MVSLEKDALKPCQNSQTAENKGSTELSCYIPLVRETLEQCYKKIDLYNRADQKYLGGIEATRLLSNIKDVLDVLPNA